MHEVFAEWNNGDLDSYLIEITRDILGTTDPETGHPMVDLILDTAGQMVTQGRMRNEEVPEFLHTYKVEKVAMEASTYIIPMYRKLTEQGYNVTVSHPKKTRYIAEARIKSDRVDSKALAELLRLDSLPVSYIPPRELAVLREKIRRRAFLVRQVSKLKVKIRDVLAYEGIKPPEGYGLFTRKGVDWLNGQHMEPVDCYLRLMAPLHREVLLLSKELRGKARMTLMCSC